MCILRVDIERGRASGRTGAAAAGACLLLRPSNLLFIQPHPASSSSNHHSPAILGFPHAYRQCGIVLATALVCGAALASRAGLRLLLLCAARVEGGGNAAPLTYRSVAAAALGAPGALAVSLAAAALNLGCLVACLNALADVGSQVAGGLVPPGAEPARGALLAAVTLGAALPAALLFRPGSRASAAVGRFAVAAVALLVGVLALFVADDAVAASGGGGGAAGAPPLLPPPSAEPLRLWRPAGAATAAPLMAYAFAAHPFLFGALTGSGGGAGSARRSTSVPPPPSLRSAVAVVRAATTAAAAAYIGVGLAGYAAFRGHTAGDVLRNLGGGGGSAGGGGGGFLSPPVRAAAGAAAKACVALSLLGTVPLVLAPLRDGAVSAVSGLSNYAAAEEEEEGGRPGSAADVEGAAPGGRPQPRRAACCRRGRPSRLGPALADASTTVAALGTALAAAALLPSVDLVLGLAGGTAAAALAHVLPAACFLRLHPRAGRGGVGSGAAGSAAGSAPPPPLPPLSALAPHAATAAARGGGGGGAMLKSPARPGRSALLRVSASGERGWGGAGPAAPAPPPPRHSSSSLPSTMRGDRVRAVALLAFGAALAVSGTAATLRAAGSAADVAAAATALASARAGLATAAAAVGAMNGGGGGAAQVMPSRAAPLPRAEPAAAASAAAAAAATAELAAQVLEKAPAAVVAEAGPIAVELERVQGAHGGSGVAGTAATPPAVMPEPEAGLK